MKSTYTNIGGRLAALAAGFAPVSVFAEAGQPTPWQLGLQDPVTPVMENIVWFHSWLMIVITVITLFVAALLVYVMVRFRAKANPIPSTTTHHTGIEVAWTVIPILILVAIVIPSFRLLYLQRDIPAADMTIKIQGNPSWNWTYDYPDLGLNDDKTSKVVFTAYLKPEKDAVADKVPYLLATDLPMVVPVNKTVKILVTSDPDGIIHSWTVPSFGLKIDAIPGRINEDWFKVTKAGIYYGQCSELCGKDHAFMPIEVWAVDDATMAKWGDFMKTGPKPDALQQFLKTIKPAAQTVASN
ncbi:MAG: cytochrome c oxidase subunit II [Alphaproteobacteria bacterium]|nr:cytochrome c oxidase subunit II [Alphaproteobacteria bacterium]